MRRYTRYTVYEKIFDFFMLQFQLGFYFSIDKYKKQYLKEKKWRVTPPTPTPCCYVIGDNKKHFYKAIDFFTP